MSSQRIVDLETAKTVNIYLLIMFSFLTLLALFVDLPHSLPLQGTGRDGFRPNGFLPRKHQVYVVNFTSCSFRLILHSSD
jgi:hypothetical protein